MFISPFETIGGIVWFPRMLKKIRMQDRGELPEVYYSYMGRGFDERCVRFLQVDYEDVVTQTQAGLSDSDILEWCFENGYQPSDLEKSSQEGLRPLLLDELGFKADESFQKYLYNNNRPIQEERE